MRADYPTYEFSSDDDSSIQFKIVPLQLKTEYDSTSPHRHNYYEIFMFFGGEGKHTIDFDVFDIEDNSIHFVSPGQVHHVERGLGTHGFVILFSREFVSLQKSNQALLFDLPFFHQANKPLLNLSSEEIAPLKTLVEQMKEESSQDKHTAEIIRSFLKLFLMKADRLHQAYNPVELSIYKSEAYRNFRLLLEKHFTIEQKVSAYADMLAMSEKQLNELCKKTVGKTVSELISERVILEAKRLLKHSSKSHKEIAYTLNFNDPAHFSKYFKLKTGISPSDF